MISRVTRLDKERVEFFGCLMIQLCAVMYIHTPSLQQVDNPLSFVEEHGLSDHAIHFHGSFRECRWDVVTGALNQPVDRASTAAQLRPMFGVSLSQRRPCPNPLGSANHDGMAETSGRSSQVIPGLHLGETQRPQKHTKQFTVQVRAYSFQLDGPWSLIRA